MIIPLLVVDERIIKGVEEALQNDSKTVLLLAAKKESSSGDTIGTEDLYQIGTVASLMRLIKIPDGSIKILVQGICRAQVTDIVSKDSMLHASIKPLELSVDEHSAELAAQIRNIKSVAEQMASSGQSPTPDFHLILSKMHDAEKIADFVLSHLTLSVMQAQELLEKEFFVNFLEGLYRHLAKEIEVAEVQERIKHRTRDSMNQAQKEFYLREQMKAIRKELGEGDTDDISGYREKLLQASIAEESKQEVERQINRLEKTAADSMEAAVIRNYLDLVFALPWGVSTKDNLLIDHAKKVLDEDHFGLQEVKDRILDFISVRVLNKTGNAPILCLAGPPGTGKTSLGSSIARALGRSYYRVALGGIKDEAEIRGHRRTYVGAMPGRFIQGIRKAGSMNPVIIIDEIDKIGNDFRGDPSAALLELLDPQQNKSFYDNYLGIPFDLSGALFIATANDIGTISEPLRDRMEIITLAGYSPEEKREIAKRHLLKGNCLDAGLLPEQFKIEDSVLDDVILNYTRESGVRELDRLIKKLCSKVARSLVEKNELIVFSNVNLDLGLGPRKYEEESYDKLSKVGVTNGLAWTSAGGEIIKIEAVTMKGSGKLILTGRLGEVMKESAEAALTYVRSRYAEFGLDAQFYRKLDVHVHVPEGATPKDGPSAGVAIAAAMVSALAGIPIRREVAMTGEITLRGRVLPVGGLNEKTVAALRAGVKLVLWPEQNRKDLDELPKEVREGLEIRFIDTVDEALKIALAGPLPAKTVPAELLARQSSGIAPVGPYQH